MQTSMSMRGVVPLLACVRGVAAAAAVAGLAAVLAPSTALAAAGDLDPTYGIGGRQTLSFTTSVVPADSAVQPDGKLLVATGLDNTPTATEAFGVVRLRVDGSLDTAFGQHGVASAVFTNFINAPAAMALQPDGRILVAGNAMSADGTLSEFAIARFKPNGALDASFGSGGRVTTNFVGVMPGGVSNPATALVLSPDKRIVVGGAASQCAHCTHDLALARYQANGALDPTFGVGGRVQVAGLPPPNAMALLSNGHLLVLAGSDVAEFDKAGVQVTVTSTTRGARIVARGHVGISGFLADGRIVLAQNVSGVQQVGRCDGSVRDVHVQVSRFMPLGNMDLSFARPLFDFGPGSSPCTNAAQAVLPVDGDGTTLVGGLSTPALSTDVFGVGRLTGDGALDPAFGNGGTVTTAFGQPGQFGFSFVDTLARQADGKVLAIGISGDHQAHTWLTVARYLRM